MVSFVLIMKELLDDRQQFNERPFECYEMII